MGMHLGVIGFQPLHSPPFARVCFTPKHTLDLTGLYILHFVANPMLGLQQLATKFEKCSLTFKYKKQIEYYIHVYIFSQKNSYQFCMQHFQSLFLIC
jgi:hypothetical protein